MLSAQGLPERHGLGTTEVISMCHVDHIEVWKKTSRLLPRFVNADRFVVYVPESDVAKFASVSGANFEVRTQESLSKSFLPQLVEKVRIAGNEIRLGWYLQQFNKIQALSEAGAERLVIWDADCVPVRPQTLFDEVGRAVYMRGTERHQPYFDLIGRLFGKLDECDFSFVVPGFPVHASWVNDFLLQLELKNGGLPWHGVLLREVDFGLKSGFSETETLGTWVANSYPKQWRTTDFSWERLGRSKFGPVERFTVRGLVNLGRRTGLGIISFENWDNPPAPPFLVRFVYRVMNTLRRKVVSKFRLGIKSLQ